MRIPLMLLPAMGCDGQLWARQIMDLAKLAQPEFGDLSQDAVMVDAFGSLGHPRPGERNEF